MDPIGSLTLTPLASNTTGEVKAASFSLLESALIGIVIVLIICLTVVNNFLVLLSYYRDPELKDIHNLYLVHLAFCDFMTGLITMPLQLYLTENQKHWGLGRTMCKLMLTTQLVFINMPSLIVVLVAMELMNTLKAHCSKSVQTSRRDAYMKLTFWWLFTIILNAPAILFWDVLKGKSSVPSDKCFVEYMDNWDFTLLVEVLTCVLPIICLVDAYAALSFALKHHLFDRRQEDELNATSVSVSVIDVSKKMEKLMKSIRAHRLSNSPQTASCSRRAPTLQVPTSPAPTAHHQLIKEKREWVEQTLFWMVVVFCVCWIPFSVANIVNSACKKCLSVQFFETLKWIQSSKACIDPFLFAYTSNRYRKNFYEIVTCSVRNRSVDDDLSLARSTPTLIPPAEIRAEPPPLSSNRSHCIFLTTIPPLEVKKKKSVFDTIFQKESNTKLKSTNLFDTPV